jgi:hypothetical protein
MIHRKCTICGKDIVLVSSAAERARKFGGRPEEYLRLFTTHGKCEVAKRTAQTLELIKRNRDANS